MLITTCGAGFRGAIGQLVSVQLHHTRGARFHVSGMHWNHAKHILARIYAALEVLGLPRPSGAFTLHIGPAHVKPESNELDVPIALCLLSISGLIDPQKLTNLFSLGELALDGSLRVDASLQTRSNFTFNPIQIAEADQVNRCLIPPGGDYLSRRLIPTKTPTFEAHHLKEALSFLQNKRQLSQVVPPSVPTHSIRIWPTPLFDSIVGQSENKKALVIAAAGQHHTFIMGPPGSGKTLMARSLSELTPFVNRGDREHLNHLHSLRKEDFTSKDRAPFRQPHVQATPAALTGSWNATGALPGELALSHRGIFFLDEFPEFSRNALEALRGPLEEGFIELNRAQGSCRFPCKTLAVATANPCPCGHLTRRNGRCRCTPGVVKKYLSRMTGPLMDRFAIHIETQLQERNDSIRDRSSMTGKEAIAAVQWVRLQKNKIDCSQAESIPWSNAVQDLLQRWSNRHGLSRRGYESLQKVTETICMLEAWRTKKDIASLKITEHQVVMATRFRIFDQSEWLNRAFHPNWPQHRISD